MSARKRSRPEFTRTARRAIDKEIKSVNVASTTTQTVTTLKTTTFPCTIVGLRWDISYIQNVTVNGATVLWAIVVVKDGNSANTLSLSNGGDTYTPEQNVLTWGVLACPDSDLSSGPLMDKEIGASKTMRKLMGGDLLQFIQLSNVASSGSLKGVVQFFCKS